MGVRIACSLLLGLTMGAAGAQIADPVVARRGTAVVHLSEVDARVSQLPADVRAGYMDSPERIEQLIQGLLLDKQLAAEALELGLDKQPHFDTELALARDQILARRRSNQFLETLDLPDFEVLARERYLAAKDKYATPERLDLIHVLVRAIGRTEEDAEAIARRVHAMAVSGEKPFEDLVAEFSDERNAQTGNRTDGVLKNVERGRMVGEFEEAAFALQEPGDISPVVKTIYGWHVIKLLERKPRQVPSFEDVKSRIVRELRTDFIERAKKYHVAKLRSMELDADPKVVASLRTRYMTDRKAGPATWTESGAPAADSGDGDEDAAASSTDD